MKRRFLYRTTALLVLLMLTVGMVSESTCLISNVMSVNEARPIRVKVELNLVYDNIWGSIYNPVVRQCDKTPTITGDGSRINPKKASKHRWIAISQQMLHSNYRQKLLIYKRTNLFKGKINYGDTIWVESPYKSINGWWVVHDTKNSDTIYDNSIDFLQTLGDKSLYNNDKLWSGRFDNIKIYTIKNHPYRTYHRVDKKSKKL